MVDVGGKAVTRRVARAGARVWMAPETLRAAAGAGPAQGRRAGRGQGGRHHGGEADLRAGAALPPAGAHPGGPAPSRWPRTRAAWTSSATTRTEDRTGVEMEALTGAATAAITIYDMCKAVDRGMVIGDLRLLEKTGGKEDYVRPAEPARGAGPARPAARRPRAGGPLAGTVVAVNVSAPRASARSPPDAVMLRVEHGIEGDAHAGEWHRQVSLLAQESIDKMIAAGLDVGPGDFAENITTSGLEVDALPLLHHPGAGRGAGGGHPDRQGVPLPLRHLPSGGRLRHAARGHLRAGAAGGPRGPGRPGAGAGLGSRARRGRRDACVGRRREAGAMSHGGSQPAHPGRRGHPERQGERRAARGRLGAGAAGAAARPGRRGGRPGGHPRRAAPDRDGAGDAGRRRRGAT